jgi:predicted O-methyltransferase YrrM
MRQLRRGDELHVPPSARVLRRASGYLARLGAGRVMRTEPVFDDPHALFDFASSFEFAGVRIAPVQLGEEFIPFLGLVASERPETIMEIGTAAGGTLFMLTRVASDGATLVALDFATREEERFAGSWTNYRRKSLYKSFARRGQRVEFLFADSHLPGTLVRIERILGGRPVDVLFIDGDHSAEGVRMYFELYSPLVRSGGMIAFHDIVPGEPEAVGGVPEVWQTLKDETAQEIVRDWTQGGYGIGVLRKK